MRRNQDWWIEIFREATESDLRAMGANDSQIAALGKRNQRRGGQGFGVTGSSGSHFHQDQSSKSSAIVPSSTSSMTKAPSSAMTKAPSSAMTKSDSRGGALAKTGEVIPASGGPKPNRPSTRQDIPDEEPINNNTNRNDNVNKKKQKSYKSLFDGPKGDGPYMGQTPSTKTREKSNLR
jgi:hypothetical protein